MKKLFVLSLLFLSLPVMATESVITDFSNTCGNYKVLNAVFEQSYTCASGYYLPANSRTCAICPVGMACDGGTFMFNANLDQGLLGTVIISDFTNTCGDYKILNAVFEPDIVTCASGYYLPENSRTCSACPNGVTCNGGTFVFNVNHNQGMTVTCASGYYLPANSRTCTACSNGVTCNGGTFVVDENRDQGILGTVMFSDFTNTCGGYKILNAVFEQTQPTCASGQYLPKNTTACASCPNGYTCAGGTYNFDANNDQGKVANVITLNWVGASAEDIAANNAGTVTYGGDIRTPRAATLPPGKVFVGWRFVKPSQN